MDISDKNIVFCGIDPGKARHAAAFIDRDARAVAPPMKFAGDAAGFAKLLERLGQVGGPSAVRVAMEATGHYWYALEDRLRREGYGTFVLNPIQTKREAARCVRKVKTDPVDAVRIAVVLKNGGARATLVPGEPAMACRQLTRLWYELGDQTTRVKLLLRSRLEPVWPEFETLFSDPFAKTARALMALAPTPTDLLAIEPAVLEEMLGKSSRGRFGKEFADGLRTSAAESVGMKRGLDGSRIGIRTLLAELDALRPIRKGLQAEIESLSARLPTCLFTLPGADAVRGASLFGETDPVSGFAGAEQLVAFAGLDPTVYQTGNFNAEHCKISKRGSPHLRRTLWTMAHVALKKDGPLREQYRKKRAAGMHHLAAVTAAAAKLTRIAWRVLTDGRAYTPEPPSRTPASSG